MDPRFDLDPHPLGWMSWAEVETALFPGQGRRSLSDLSRMGGIYLLAWSREQPKDLGPHAGCVRYIGECDSFLKRLGQFGRSAGFWSAGRKDGHSGGLRWPQGKREHLWVLLHPLDAAGLRPHVATGHRKWMEALALDEHFLAHGALPRVNTRRGTFDPDEQPRVGC